MIVFHIIRYKMFLISKIMGLSIVLIILSACGGDSLQNPKKSQDIDLVTINGHTLPPEPDPSINNSTLLGVDSNNNGVRDDVEIWIFHTYKEPIVQAVAMQNARAFQIILADPSKARETKRFMEQVTDCSLYYQRLAEDYNDTIVIPRSTNLYKESKPLILNTRERNRAYYERNQALSGGIYPGRPWDTFKGSCDFNATKVLRGEW